MINVMVVTVVDGKLEATETGLKAFNTDNVIDHIADAFENGVLPEDLEVDERNDDYITVTVSSVHTDDGDIDVLFIGKRGDYTGELMS